MVTQPSCRVAITHHMHLMKNSYLSHALKHLYKENKGKHVGINECINQEKLYLFKLPHSKSLSSLKIEGKGSSRIFANIRCHPHD